MGIEWISLVVLIGLFGLLAAGVPVGFTSGILAVAVLVMRFGFDVVLGTPGSGPLNIISQRIYGLMTDYVMISVPLFILMANMLERSRIAHDMFDAIQIWVGRLRGGLAIVTSLMATIMATMSGIIGGEIVLLGLVALPQMLRLGYDKKLSVGVICASGSLGAMLPPSIVLIVFGLVAEASITSLFRAALIPGLVLATSYILYIIIVTWRDPSLAPSVSEVRVPLKEKINALRGLLAPLLVAASVLGSIYGGLTGITEAAAIGVIVVGLLIVVRKEFSVELLRGALVQTVRSTGSIMWVVFGASALAGAYSVAGGPDYISRLIIDADLPPLGVIVGMTVVFILLGCVMDWIGIVLLVMPVFLPVVRSLGYDPIWFGVLFCVTMQLSFLTPPFGPAAFYLKSVAPKEITLVDIFRSFTPFIIIQAAVVALIVLYPPIVALR